VSRSRYALLALIYAMVVIYASTIVGVLGPNFVPIDPSEALRQLIHMPYVEHGSDQRSDWMGNLIMLVPLGFLVAGWLCSAPRSSRDPRPSENDPPSTGPSEAARADFQPCHDGSGDGTPPPGSSLAERDKDGRVVPAAIGAFLLCVAFILVVKSAQLFFPPRTVTLNYVLAQSIGAFIGILLFAALRSPLVKLRRNQNRLESLRITLRIYTGLLVLFMLLPLDFALNAEDLAAQFDKLPDTVLGLSGEARPMIVWIAVAVSGMLATAPIGAMLALVGRGRVYVGRSTSAVAWIGCFAMLGLYVLTTLVISGAASLPAVITRTIGIALGSWFMHWLTRQNPEDVREDLGDLVPRAIPIYLLTLFGVNGLLSLDWNTPQAAIGELNQLGLLPLFNYYIVSKAQAAKNIVGHAAMYAPIGIMVWLRMENGARLTALVLGAVLSAIVETGRFFRPGLAPDINAIPLAALSSWASGALMPALWRMLAAVPLARVATAPSPDAAVANWRDRDANRRTRRRDRSNRAEQNEPNAAHGADIEHY
jgi:VanZ family protein